MSKESICPRCGGSMSYDHKFEADFCSECGSMFDPLTGEYRFVFGADADGITGIITCSVSRDEAVKALEDYINSEKRLDKSFDKKTLIEGLHLEYVPVRVVRSGVKVYMSGEADKAALFRLANVPFSSGMIGDEVINGIEPFEFAKAEEFDSVTIDEGNVEDETVEPLDMKDTIISRLDILSEQMSAQFKLDDHDSFISSHYGTIAYPDMLFDLVYVPVWYSEVVHGSRTLKAAINGQTGKASAELPLTLSQARKNVRSRTKKQGSTDVAILAETAIADFWNWFIHSDKIIFIIIALSIEVCIIIDIIKAFVSAAVMTASGSVMESGLRYFGLTGTKEQFIMLYIGFFVLVFAIFAVTFSILYREEIKQIRESKKISSAVSDEDLYAPFDKALGAEFYFDQKTSLKLVPLRRSNNAWDKF